MAENLAPLKSSRNTSKLDRGVDEWLDSNSEHAPKLSDERRQRVRERETKAREAVRREIRRRLEAWRSR
jgi:hypothetical protein